MLAADEEVFVADAFNGDGRVRTQTRHTAGVYAYLARGQALAVNAHGLKVVAVQGLRGAAGVDRAATAGDGVACAVVGLAVVDVVIGLRAIRVIRQAVVLVFVATAGGEQERVQDNKAKGMGFHEILRQDEGMLSYCDNGIIMRLLS